MSDLNTITNTLSNPIILCSAVGLGTSSFFSWGNIALHRMGVMSLIQPASARRLHISSAQALALWEANYDSGITHFAPTAALGTLAFATGSYLSPAGSLRRTLLASAFGAYVVIIPFTLLFIKPVNNTLKKILRGIEARAHASNANAALAMTVQEEQTVAPLMARWQVLNVTRFTFGLVGWGAAALSLLVSAPQ